MQSIIENTWNSSHRAHATDTCGFNARPWNTDGQLCNLLLRWLSLLGLAGASEDSRHLTKKEV
jgi:hypothetical protein